MLSASPKSIYPSLPKEASQISEANQSLFLEPWHWSYSFLVKKKRCYELVTAMTHMGWYMPSATENEAGRSPREKNECLDSSFTYLSALSFACKTSNELFSAVLFILPKLSSSNCFMLCFVSFSEVLGMEFRALHVLCKCFTT